jgi:cob(I)alamin adenosyltransferase
MPRLTKIYTKKGDEGMTSLGGGQKVSKDSLRVAVYGTVDELNSQIGVALAYGLSETLRETLLQIQNALPQIEERHVVRLEQMMDKMTEVVGPLENFILPGGSVGSAHLHMARTICRRAEREAATLAHSEPVGPWVLPYLNRLSDALFVMARFENHMCEVPEPLWRPGA